MIKKIGILTAILLIFGLVINFGYAQATMIYIKNAGFERPEQGEGEYTCGDVRGWEIYSENQGTYYTGVWNPTGDDYTGGEPDGNVGYIDIESGDGVVWFEQTLSATLMANTTYFLQVDVGNPLWGNDANWVGFPGYGIELLAGDVRLDYDDNSLSPSDGTYLTSELSFFTAQSDHPGVGQALTIRLLNISADEGREVDFDNVRLDAAPIATPEPATMLLVGLGLLGLGGLYRRKK